MGQTLMAWAFGQGDFALLGEHGTEQTVKIGA
jgi:hypothetical protein